jgi:neurofibromin 1
VRERLQASVALEIALLVSLCSGNKDVCDDASQCIGLLCKEARMADLDEGGEVKSVTIACNLKIYEELSADDSKFIGRKAQQKRIRKYLRMLPQHTPGNMAAWEEAWKRWKQLTLLMNRISDDLTDDASIDTTNSSLNNGTTNNASTLVSSSSNSIALTANSNSNLKKLPLPRGVANSNNVEKTRNLNTSSTLMTNTTKSQQNLDTYEDKAIEWQNFTGFLAALGGCCLDEIDPGIWAMEQQQEARRISSPNQPIIMVDRFIGEMSDMLVSENVYISEGIKDTLGNDLSPALYVILFRHLEAYMVKCFDTNGDAIRSPQNKMFVEQSVLVLRLILDRLVNPGDCLLNIDFSTLIHRFADYLNRLPNTYITLRIKIKMCLLIEAVMQKKEHIVVRDEMRLRNKLLEICVEWTSDFALVSM